MQQGIDSLMGEVLESGVEEKNHVSGMQSGVDASHGQQLGGCLKACQVKRKRDDEMVQSQVDASHGQLGEGLETHQVKRRRRITDDFQYLLRFHGQTLITVDLQFAKIALDFYEKRQDAKFEILEVLFSNRAILGVPGFEGVGPWCHVSFIAKPKNSDCCGKHFFGEMVFDHASKQYDVTYCSIFDPSDPGSVEGCVFCPGSEIFLHPPDGCPAGGRKIENLMAQKGTDASQGQVRGCSKRHHGWRGQYCLNADALAMTEKANNDMILKYARIALEFFEKSKDAAFEVVTGFQSIRRRVVVPGTKNIEEWVHVCFTAKPRNDDCIDFTPEHFFAELLRDATTGKYSAAYCEIFEPRCPEVPHNCIICPKDVKQHPSEGYRVGRPPYSIAEETYFEDLQLDLNLNLK